MGHNAGPRDRRPRRRRMNDWPVLARYEARQLREIALPIGGIGTGSFSLAGRGQLVDWQLMGRPHRGWRPLYSHFVLWTRAGPPAQPAKVRVLEQDLDESLAADSGAPAVLAGIPRWRDAAFEASYPFGRLL